MDWNGVDSHDVSLKLNHQGVFKPLASCCLAQVGKVEGLFSTWQVQGEPSENGNTSHVTNPERGKPDALN
jgi:hypothetical protein